MYANRIATTLGILVLAALASSGCRGGAKAESPAASAPATVSFLTQSGEILVRVEVAHTPSARSRGLMHRTELRPHHGMIFVFPKQERQAFWMKNTLIPLDMIFIDQKLRVVGVVEQAEPLTLTQRAVSAPSKYVVEVDGGFARSVGIVPGTRVELQGIPPAASSPRP